MYALQNFCNYKDKHYRHYLKGDMTKREYFASKFSCRIKPKVDLLKMSTLLIKDYLTNQFYNALAKLAKSNLRII